MILCGDCRGLLCVFLGRGRLCFCRVNFQWLKLNLTARYVEKVKGDFIFFRFSSEVRLYVLFRGLCSMICPTATSSRVWGRAIKIFMNVQAGFIRRGLQSICLMMSLLCSLIRLSDFIRRSDLRNDNGLWLSLYLPVLFYYESFINFEIVASF